MIGQDSPRAWRQQQNSADNNAPVYRVSSGPLPGWLDLTVDGRAGTCCESLRSICADPV
jgi:hypothetical protein